MTVTSDAPADTTMMRIVHDALRRDLATSARRRSPTPSCTREAQRRAIGAHLTWMVGFLHAHHASEDDGLYPLVRERAGWIGRRVAVLDRMAREHEAIAPAIGRGGDGRGRARGGSVRRCRRSGRSPRSTRSAVVLLPHLREEEDEAMPIASRLITAAEWQAIEQEHNLDAKSMSELGFEGHWLIDGAVEADRATVVGLVPPIPRFILLHGFARRYRRHAAACWGETDEARAPCADGEQRRRDGRRRHRRGVGRRPRRHPRRRVEPRVRRRRVARWGHLGHPRERGSGAATAPASSGGAGCARSSPPSRTSSCGGPSRPAVPRQLRVADRPRSGR